MAFRELQRRLQKIGDCFLVDKVSEADVIGNGETLAQKVEAIRESEKVVERARRCRNAGGVFIEFAKDAALGKVEEMVSARSSDARQRAQETILEYALGKPIQRSITFTGRIADSSEEELESDISKLLAELGFTEGKGTSPRLLIGTQGIQRQEQIITVQAEPRIPDELPPKP